MSDEIVVNGVTMTQQDFDDRMSSIAGKKTKEMYFRITGWDKRLEKCPFCGCAAEMWEYQPTPNYYQKVVMCSNDGDEDKDIEPCPMYMPPEGFYRSTKADALEIWNKRDKGNDHE